MTRDSLLGIICLPFHHLVRVIDCYLAEGEKFLFRVALCLALLHHKHASEHVLTLERMRVFCQSIGDLVTPQQLIVSALKITRLSRKGSSLNYRKKLLFFSLKTFKSRKQKPISARIASFKPSLLSIRPKVSLTVDLHLTFS